MNAGLHSDITSESSEEASNNKKHKATGTELLIESSKSLPNVTQSSDEAGCSDNGNTPGSLFS